MATLIELDGISPTIGEDVFLAPTAVLVGHGAMLAAGAVVPERTVVRAGALSAGMPAREKKELSGSALAWTRTAAQEYQQYRIRYTRNIRAQVSAPGEEKPRARDADRR